MIAPLISCNMQLFITVESELVFRQNIIKLFLWYCEHIGDESH
jgi:hypothetical protein